MTMAYTKDILRIMLRELKHECTRTEELLQYLECVRKDLPYTDYAFMLARLTDLHSVLISTSWDFQDKVEEPCDTQQQ